MAGPVLDRGGSALSLPIGPAAIAEADRRGRRLAAEAATGALNRAAMHQTLGASPSRLSGSPEGRLQSQALERAEEQQRMLLEMILAAVSPGQQDQGMETDLDYTDSWPRVEVSVGINEVLRVDVQDLTFDADFVVYLDWIDPKLRRGEHYTYNAEHGKFELLRTLRTCKDDLHFFNPSVTITNSKQEIEETDHLPQIFDEVLHEGCDVPWLTKKLHFVGTLACRGVNARYFPFDIEDLHIKISSPDMAGVTSLGQDRHICLVEPVLRKEWRHKRSKDTSWVKARSSDKARQSDEGMSHTWSTADVNDHNGLGVGEMQVLAFGGVSEPEGLEYTVHIVFCRQWYPRYIFDFGILNLQVFGAAASVWVPFSVDMLANRMSITLTVMLTLISSASARPPAIESLPYSTLHDTYGQFTLFCVALVGLGNWFVCLTCWGMYREAGVDDVYHAEHKMVVNMFTSPLFGDWICEKGGCGASQMDCVIFYCAMCFIVGSIGIVLVRAQMHRISTMLRIKHEVDATDQNPGQYSRLVLYKRGFELISRSEVRSCAAHVALMPCIDLFLRVWRVLRHARQSCFFARDQSGMFHATQAREMLNQAGTDDARRKLPQISRFNVKLTPHEIFRVLDVGSGEMGFYCYWMDDLSNAICCSGSESKLKYNKSQTFVDQFMQAPGGPEELAQQIIQRFKLSPMFPLSPTKTVGSGFGSPSPNPEASHTSDSAQEFVSIPVLPLPGTPAQTGEAETHPPGCPKDQAQTPTCQSRPETPVMDASPGNELTRVGTSSSRAKLMGTTLRGGRKKLIMCLTGANRQMLRDDVEGRTALEAFVRSVNAHLEKLGVECISYSPEDVDEAMYELWATEWVVQHGDLDVTSMQLEKAYRTLQGGREEAATTLQEVEAEFRDLKADEELRGAYCRAVTYCHAQAPTPTESAPPVTVPCSAFYCAFEASPPLMRALLRAKLFSGTLSAGSGSSQVTLRSAASLASSRVHSIPLGNRTPLVRMTLGGDTALFSSRLPRTSVLAQRLLCDDPDARRSGRYIIPKETRPAWSEDGPVDAKQLEVWQELVKCCAEECGLPSQQHGLFVGISAIFYAAKLAGCSGKVLNREDFVARLTERRAQLLKDGGTNGRDLANIVLVMTLVEYVLHRKALIVCKRNWCVGENGATADFVATWTLGMYLKHSGAMAVAQEAMSRPSFSSWS